VISNCDYILNKIDDKFLTLRFNEMRLLFQKGYKGELDRLKPEMFIAEIRYANYREYSNKSNNDIRKIISLLKEEYGEPEQNTVKDKYSLYKWKSVHCEIILTCREDELATTLIYSKE
jgi:hypothetical protein